MEWWSGGVMEWWSGGVMEYSNTPDPRLSKTVGNFNIT